MVPVCRSEYLLVWTDQRTYITGIIVNMNDLCGDLCNITV